MTPAPSASCLLYLFADQVIPREGIWDHVLGHLCVPTPGTEADVNLGDLEVQLLAVTLWELREAGELAVEDDPAGDRGRLYLEFGAGSDREWTGLADHVLSSMPDDGISLWGLMTDTWLEEMEGPLPLNAVVLDPQLEAAELGVTAEPDTPDLIPGFFGHHTFPPVETNGWRLEPLRPAFDDLAERWADAQGADPSVRALLTSCNRVLCDARTGVGFGSSAPRF